MTSKSLHTWKRLAILSVGPLVCACGDSESKHAVPDAATVREAGPALPDVPIVPDVAPTPVDVGPGRLDTTVVDVPLPVDVAITLDAGLPVDVSRLLDVGVPVDVAATEAAPLCTIVPAFTGGILSKDLTLTRACSPYLIKSTIRVEANRTLTIEPGVTLKFDKGTGLDVGYADAGKLVAQGTAAAPIVLTTGAATPTAGDWNGVNFYGDTMAGSVLTHVALDYCGKTNVGCIEGQSGVPSGAVAIDHVTIDHVGAGGDGIIENGTNLAFKITNTTFVAGAIPAGRFAITMDATSFAGIGAGNVYNGAPINVDGGTVATSATWLNPGTPIVVTETIRVEGTTSPILTLSPGTLLQFAANTALFVGYGNPGQLLATGTATAPIVLTSKATTPGPGDWDGIQLYNGTANGTKLAYLKLDYCGTANGGCIEGTSGVKTGFVTIDNVTIDHVGAKGNGIIENGAASNFKITNCTFPAGAIQTGQYAIYVEAPSFAGIGAGNIYNGAMINLAGGDLDASTTWVAPGTPIVVTELLRVQGAATPVLTIGAGMAFKFAAAMGIWVGYGDPGKLVVNGTAAARVDMTSLASAPRAGDWQGIIVWNAAEATLAYTDIAYAGGYASAAGGVAANSNDSRVSLSNCSVTGSAGYGVYVDCDNPNVTATGCTFTGNALADLGPGPSCP
jgi:hypothetical protein